MVSTTSPVAFGILHIASVFWLANKHDGFQLPCDSLSTLQFQVNIKFLLIVQWKNCHLYIVDAAVHMGMLRSGGAMLETSASHAHTRHLRDGTVPTIKPENCGARCKCKKQLAIEQAASSIQLGFCVLHNCG